MKKLFAILLTVAMLASMATIASAASTTTLTTTVPAASYTLSIPANQEVSFSAQYTNIGEIKVSDSNGFAEGKNLKVTISYTDFVCDGVETKIQAAEKTTVYGIPMILANGRVENSLEDLTNESAKGTLFLGE